MKTLTEQYEDYKAILFFINPDENLKGWSNETNFENHYEKNWNELMYLVEKIESLCVVVEIRENVCYIETSSENYYSELEDTKIQATYKACLNFIKWYNNQKN